jgi:hypothetical protein
MFRVQHKQVIMYAVNQASAMCMYCAAQAGALCNTGRCSVQHHQVQNKIISQTQLVKGGRTTVLAAWARHEQMKLSNGSITT